MSKRGRFESEARYGGCSLKMKPDDYPNNTDSIFIPVLRRKFGNFRGCPFPYSSSCPLMTVSLLSQAYFPGPETPSKS